MREFMGRLGDVFYWGGCLGGIWAVGYILYEAITRDAITRIWWEQNVLLFLFMGGGGWIFGWVVRYILSGYRGIKPFSPQVTEPTK